MFRLASAMLVSALLAVLGLAIAPATWAESSLSYSIHPVAGSPAAAKGYFIFEASPGDTVAGTLTLDSASDQAVDVSLAAADAFTGSQGGTEFTLPDQPVSGTGKWVTLSESQVHLEPGQSKDIAFTVRVPSDAQPGDHVAGLAAWIPAEKAEDSDSKSDGASAVVTVQMRQVIAVQVVVPGSAEQLLTVTGVKPVPTPNGMNLEIGISSAGGLLTSGTGVLEVDSTGFTSDFSLGTFVPGTSIAYPIVWTSTPKAGDYAAHVVLRYGDANAKTAEWNGKFTVGDETLAELEDRQAGPATSGNTPSSGGGTPWLVYGVVGILVIVILVMGFALLRRRKPPSRA